MGKSAAVKAFSKDASVSCIKPKPTKTAALVLRDNACGQYLTESLIVPPSDSSVNEKNLSHLLVLLNSERLCLHAKTGFKTFLSSGNKHQFIKVVLSNFLSLLYEMFSQSTVITN